MSHSFVYDRSQLERFASLVFNPNDRVVLFVSARRKYGQQGKARGCMSMNRQELLAGELHSRVCRASAVPGAYECDDGAPITREQMACYLCVNARDPAKARRELHGRLTDLAYAPPRSEPFMAAIGVGALMKPASAFKRWVTIDVDEPDQSLRPILAACEAHGVRVDLSVRSRGGYHLLFDLNRMQGEEKRALFTRVAAVCKELGETLDTDMPCPVPGTLQGGRRVTFCRGPPDLSRLEVFATGALVEQLVHGDETLALADTSNLLGGVRAIDAVLGGERDPRVVATAAAAVCFYRFDAAQYARDPDDTHTIVCAVRAVAREMERDLLGGDMSAHRVKYMS